MKSLPNYVFRLLLVALAATTAAGVYFWVEKGVKFYSVQTDSMVPALGVGDLVISEKASPVNIIDGDIISYASLADPRVVVSHRIIAIDRRYGFVTTQGDNLAAADPPVAYSQIQGKTIKAIPLAGYVLDTLRNPLGLLALIYIPVLTIGVIEIKKLASRSGRTYKHANLS